MSTLFLKIISECIPLPLVIMTKLKEFAHEHGFFFLSAKQDLLMENVSLNKLIHLNAFNYSSNLFNTSRFGKRATFAR